MSYVEEMALQFGPTDETPVEDQAAVIEAFLDGTGRVAVDAAAGTGKTTTMLTTVAETVIRESAAGNDPFDNLLLTTFTTDAASELKTRLKSVLRSHVDAGGDLRDDTFRRAETDSQIRTIDSLFHAFVRELSMELGLPNEFELEDGEALQNVRDEAFALARREHPAAFDRVETAYPDESWRAYPPASVREMVETTQQNAGNSALHRQRLTKRFVRTSMRRMVVTHHRRRSPTFRISWRRPYSMGRALTFCLTTLPPVRMLNSSSRLTSNRRIPDRASSSMTLLHSL